MRRAVKKRAAHGHVPRRAALRRTTWLVMALALILAVLGLAVAQRLNLVWEVNIGQITRLSEHTKGVLAESQGTIKVICFMDRHHPMFRPLSRLLHGMRQAALGSAGAEIAISYVDPRWDLVRAAQLTRAGVPENALLFERQHRRVVVPLEEMISHNSPFMVGSGKLREGQRTPGIFRGEKLCATAIARLALPFEQATLYWLEGHGEARFDDLDERYGFSDIARELKRGGFELKGLNLAEVSAWPEDCRALIIAGGRHPWRPAEIGLLENYLQGGGRLLYMARAGARSGLEELLQRWGVEILPYIAADRATLSGSELVISDFAEHRVSDILRNSSLVLGDALCLGVAQRAAGGSEVDLPNVTLLALTSAAGWGEAHPNLLPRRYNPGIDLPGPVAVAAAVERGGALKRDVAYKPTRLVILGESDLVMNGVLARQANANRDFFVNAVAWLAGSEVSAGSSLGGDTTLVTGFTRSQWLLFMALATVAWPAVTWLVVRRGR